MMFNFHWDVNKYKSNYDPEYWDLCRTFMLLHRSKFSEQKLVLLTEAFYQIGVYGSSYDPKTTRIVSALAIDVLEDFLKSHPGSLKHPFDKSVLVTSQAIPPNTIEGKRAPVAPKSGQSSSIWDVAVDSSIIVNVLVQSHLKSLLKGFVIVYDVRRESTMNDNKVTILEESFKRSKLGPCHWDKETTDNNICPLRLSLKWKGTLMAEAFGSEEKSLSTRLAQAVLSKIAIFSPGVEAKWSYYRDGKMPDMFDRPNPRRSSIYKVMSRSQFDAMAEITSFIDTFANSDSFAEIVFGMDYSTFEKKQIMEYITKSWGTRLTYRTVNKLGAKNSSETHVCMYQIRTGEELCRWLGGYSGENERYRVVPPGLHRRAGSCDENVREVLKTDLVDLTEEAEEETISVSESPTKKDDLNVIVNEKEMEKTIEKKNDEKAKSDPNTTNKINTVTGKNKTDIVSEDLNEDNLEKLLEGFVLFYDAKKNSEINKDDWFSALCDSFKISKYGPLEVTTETIRALRTKCVMKWKDLTLASAEGLTDTQAKTAATLQLISKLEPFTYVIQAKEDYFYNGKVPPFIENPDPSKSDVYSVVRRKDLPSYYSIFQKIDEFSRNKSYMELIFGADFTWELKNEIVVYLKAKGLDYRYFTMGDQKPWTHMALYHLINPEQLKEHLLNNGGENDKYKLIPPPKSEPIVVKTTETPKLKDTEAKKPVSKVAEKRKRPPSEPKEELEIENNKIQIKLKNFKKEKVEYPEDTGGDFPGLILWVGFKKNSTVQKNIFCILVESFKMSKYGDLLIEETEENVWGKKAPMKKCVIKSNRKVLSVGFGDTKTEAKNSAAMQVLRQLRKNCYAIQAKESYYKEGKATPFDFNPDPNKTHVYRLVKRTQFKDRGSIIKYVDNFAKKLCSEEVIFGDDFGNDERESVLFHCRQINFNYRLMKCQSASKFIHTHVAIYHQIPLPSIKAELMKSDGENDRFKLIPPNGQITNQASNEDMWPETLEDETKEKQKPALNDVKQNNATVNNISQIANGPKNISEPSNNVNIDSKKHSATQDKTPKNKCDSSDVQTLIDSKAQLKSEAKPPSYYLVLHEDAPLAFGPQPQYVQLTIQPGEGITDKVLQPITASEPAPSADSNTSTNTVKGDLREELEKKRKVVQKEEEGSDGWSRTVFVAERGTSISDKEMSGKTEDLRDKIKNKSEERTLRINSPTKKRRITPVRNHRYSPDRDRRRFHLESGPRRGSPPRRFDRDRHRFPDRPRDERIVRERSPPLVRNRWRERSRSPRRYTPHLYDDEARLPSYINRTVKQRELWRDIPARFTETVFMYKYVKQDSTTERDPFALLRATLSTDFNIDFEFIKKQTAIDEWHVVVELIADNTSMRPLVGESYATTHDEAKLIAAQYAIDTMQKSCRIIEPNYRYFAEGDIPEFIARKSPMKTPMYEIIQNLDPTKPLDRYTIDCMFNMFMKSGLEDLFFLATDFSYLERVLVIDVANQLGLWWRLFGPRHPSAPPDDTVSTQHVCVYKRKSTLQLIEELLDNGGSTEKYAIVDPRETRLTLPSDRPRHGFMC